MCRDLKRELDEARAALRTIATAPFDATGQAAARMQRIAKRALDKQ